MNVFLDSHTLRTKYPAGIPRYTIELLRAFRKLESKYKVFCGIWADDLFEEIYLTSVIKQKWPDISGIILSRFYSRSSLDWVYKNLRNFSPEDFKSQFYRKFKMPWKLWMIFKSILNWDQQDRFLTRQLNGSAINIFHGTFHPLPTKGHIKKIPRLLTIYDLLPMTHPEFFTASGINFFKKILGSINCKDDTLICISEFTRQKLISFLPDLKKRCFITPLAAPAHFKPVKDFKVLNAVLSKWGLEKERYFLSVATVEPRKNFHHLISCYLEMLKDREIQNCPLVLTGAEGWGGAPEEIKQMVGKAGGNVILTGYLKDEELQALYSAALCFIYIPLCEGFGLPPLEAMQCGVPTITSNTASLPEVVGDAALKVDPMDKALLRKTILQIINDKLLHSELKNRGLARARLFSWRKTAELTSEAYEYALRD